MFREELGWFDRGSGLLYTNIFDAMLDAVYYALNGTGYSNVPLLVGEARFSIRRAAGVFGKDFAVVVFASSSVLSLALMTCLYYVRSSLVHVFVSRI